MTVRTLRAAMTAILLGTAVAAGSALVLASPAAALTASPKVGPLLKEAVAMISAKNYKGAQAKLNEAEAVKSNPDDETVINQMRRAIAVSSVDLTQPHCTSDRMAVTNCNGRAVGTQP